MDQMCCVVDEVPNTAAAGTDHFASIWFKAFGSGSAYESLGGGEETREEGEFREGRDLGICFHRGFTKDSEAIE